MTNSEGPPQPTLEDIVEEQKRLSSSVSSLAEAVQFLSSGQESLSDAIKALAEGQISLSEAVKSLSVGGMSLGQVLTTLGEDADSKAQQIALLTSFVAEQRELNTKFRASMGETAETLVEIRKRVDGTNSKVDGLRDDIGLVKGGHARNAMHHNLARIAAQFGFELISEVPQAAIIGFSKVATARREPSNETESFRNADMVMNVLDADGKPGYIALEASFTLDGNDIRRAMRNADYLHQYTGLPCYAAVAGVEILPEAQAQVDAGNALLYRIPARELQSE